MAVDGQQPGLDCDLMLETVVPDHLNKDPIKLLKHIHSDLPELGDLLPLVVLLFITKGGQTSLQIFYYCLKLPNPKNRLGVVVLLNDLLGDDGGESGGGGVKRTAGSGV